MPDPMDAEHVLKAQSCQGLIRHPETWWQQCAGWGATSSQIPSHPNHSGSLCSYAPEGEEITQVEETGGLSFPVFNQGRN